MMYCDDNPIDEDGDCENPQYVCDPTGAICETVCGPPDEETY